MMEIRGINVEDITCGLNWIIITIVITKPIIGRTGNFLTLNGDIKGLRKLGCLNRRLITDRFTNANTTNILNTEILATSEILPVYRIIVAKVKAIVNIIANHGVFLEEWTSASIEGMALSYFAMPNIILDPDISIIRTVLVVANNARMVSMIIPLLPNALDAASARGAFDLDISSHPTNATVDMATRI